MTDKIHIPSERLNKLLKRFPGAKREIKEKIEYWTNKFNNDPKDAEFKEYKFYMAKIGEVIHFDYPEQKKPKEIKDSPFYVFEKEGQALEFIKKQPIFYDKSGIWWIWNLEEHFWEYCDDITILNGIRKSIGINTINSKERTEIINALKQIGREHAPEEVEKNWIQFKDKIVDIDTGEIFKAESKYFITNPIPWKIGETEETPTLDKYFKEWVVAKGLQDESYIKTLYEIIAYSCLKKQFLQRLFAFVGSGSNGKGVFLSILRKLLGKNNICSTELRILAGNQFESSGLYKKQACFMGEVDAYDMENTNLIKKLSGEDDIRYCFKGKTPFTERSSTTCLMNTNSLPVSPDKSKGFYRRWLIIDFPHEFPVGRDILSEIPEKEFENLCKKIIRIAKELIETKRFTNEGNIELRRKKYEDRSNPIIRFVQEHCTEDFEDYEILKKFAFNLNKYLERNRLRPMSNKAIAKRLKDENYDIIRTTKDSLTTRYIIGVKLINALNVLNDPNMKEVLHED